MCVCFCFLVCVGGGGGGYWVLPPAAQKNILYGLNDIYVYVQHK